MQSAQTTKKHSPFSAYSTYVTMLKRLSVELPRAADWNIRVDAALNGQASTELRRLVSLETRRKFGAFFTGTQLSSRLADCSTEVGAESVFYDPTCGMGDLLLAAARKLPLRKTLPDTLRQWGKQLTGTDLHREFVEGARTRLVLLARQRHGTDEPLGRSNDYFFPNIRVGDGIKEKLLFRRATHLLLNPPFGQVTAPLGCHWAGGRITEAALFVVAALEQAKPGTEMLAVLPEVLRSGSFSERWRKRINQLAEIKLVQPHGLFDGSADVDVFILSLTRIESETKSSGQRWIPVSDHVMPTIGDLFCVHVGQVVPHRDPQQGRSYSYVHPRCAPAWAVMREFPETRRHSGSAFTPPFVVIRRTSRPGDLYRATATIIAGKDPVAVENHLIVCKPRDGRFSSCKDLMRKLKTAEVNEFLDSRIRCRHLTVAAVRDIPWLS